MIYTGWSEVEAGVPFFEHLKEAFLHGEGARSVFVAALIGVLTAVLFYRRQRLFSVTQAFRYVGQGAMKMRTLALLMLLAFALGALSKELQTGAYLAGILHEHVHFVWIPALFFVLSCLISFSTGTSWGTFAIVLSLVLPVTQATGADAAFCVAAVLGGGVFGDHCSPISDTTLISALAADCKLISHLNTQLPYALLAGAFSCVLYVAWGFWSM